MSDEKNYKQLQTVQSLNAASLITAPVSLLAGGVVLSGASLACAIVALAKVKGLARSGAANEGPMKESARRLRTQSVVAIVVASAALIMNLAWFAAQMAGMMEMIQSGDYSELTEALEAYMTGSGSASSESSSAGSIWDQRLK